MTRLNLSSVQFCEYIGLPHHSHILQQLRALNLVRFFKIGNKYMYPKEDAEKVSDLLREQKISLKTNNGYYITIND